MYGDCLAERGGGIGGGGISESASGDTEAFSESSVDVAEIDLGLGGCSKVSATDSASSLSAWALIMGVEPVFRL